MPYIGKPNRKKVADTEVEIIHYCDIQTAGELQYAIALMIKNYIKRQGLKYQICNDVMGALAGAQMEFYRKIVAPYEERKIEENGEV